MTELSIPTLQANQVLIKVKAFSINPMDWKIRKGEMTLMSGSSFPKFTGTDFAGIVESMGSAVSDLKQGDEVFGVVANLMREGASAEYLAVPASLVWKKPSQLSFAQAASIPVVGTAAVTALDKMGSTTAYTSVLINGATGGFGMMLLQLLTQKGARVTAVTNPGGMAYAKKWGADQVIDYTKENVLSGKVTYDVVIDLSNKMGYRKAKAIMKPKSVFLNPTPKPIEIPLSIIKNLFTGQKHLTLLSNPSSNHINTFLRAFKEGLEIEVNKVFDFANYREAYAYAEQGGVIGKVVVELS